MRWNKLTYGTRRVNKLTSLEISFVITNWFFKHHRSRLSCGRQRILQCCMSLGEGPSEEVEQAGCVVGSPSFTGADGFWSAFFYPTALIHVGYQGKAITWLRAKILGSTWKYSAGLDGAWSLPLHKTHLYQSPRIFLCSLSRNCPRAKKLRTTKSTKMQLKVHVIRMEAVRETSRRNCKAWQKKSILPRVKGTWEAYLTVTLAICTQFNVIIYYGIELKCEFAIATRAANGGIRCFPKLQHLLRKE